MIECNTQAGFRCQDVGTRRTSRNKKRHATNRYPSRRHETLASVGRVIDEPLQSAQSPANLLKGNEEARPHTLSENAQLDIAPPR
eukprot:8920080-Pyramimonas_sp.AAC.1